ncbi:MAG: SPOR domain-containing protein [Paludibacteraceae bacterium]|nr:SPOR domain-containing protein [Paludibacteraceae bacterium]
MKRIFLLVFFVISIACSAAKYTQQMYAPATDANAVSSEEPANTEYLDTEGNKLTLKYFVVVGSFSDRLNAQNLLDQIMQTGKGMPIIIISQDGMARVCYFASNNEAEVRKVMTDIKDEYPSAWFLNISK